jgi:hypothetical protein
MRKQIALTVLIFIFSNVVSSDSGTVTICDNGKYKIQDDIDGEEGVCNGHPIIIHEYLQPAGMEHCQLVIDEVYHQFIHDISITLLLRVNLNV